MACTPFSSILSARKLAAPLKSLSPGRQLPVAVTSSRANLVVRLVVRRTPRADTAACPSRFDQRPPIRPARPADEQIGPDRRPIPHVLVAVLVARAADRPAARACRCFRSREILAHFRDRRHPADQVEIHPPAPLAVARRLGRSQIVILPRLGNGVVDQRTSGRPKSSLGLAAGVALADRAVGWPATCSAANADANDRRSTIAHQHHDWHVAPVASQTSPQTSRSRTTRPLDHCCIMTECTLASRAPRFNAAAKSPRYRQNVIDCTRRAIARLLRLRPQPIATREREKNFRKSLRGHRSPTRLARRTVPKRCIRKIHVYYFATVQKDRRTWVQPLGEPRFACDVSVSRLVCEFLWEVGRSR